MKNVLFVASECTPFVKTGGLADVIGSLPQALQARKGLDVRVILPLYDEIAPEWREKMVHHMSIDVTFGWRVQQAHIYTLKHDNVLYYFIGNDYYFTRKGVYGYYDDGERFVFFSHAVTESFNHLDFQPDILHAHDWQAALTIPLVKILQPESELKTVLTIHNLKYQGIMPLSVYDDFFHFSREHVAGFEWDGMFNCLKSALFHADKITTVSPSYAEEIKDPYFGEGLDPLLREREADLVGVINGIDTSAYNPLTDDSIPVPYRSSREKKRQNKEALQKEVGLPVNGEMPVYTMISRFVEQKGLHLLERILDEFLEEDVQLVMLGTGEAEFEDYFAHKAAHYPEKLKTLLTFDEGLARRLYAGADFFLMPSKFEPCGLSQLISLRYKTVPIVRETGGLKDTIIPFNEITGEGNGFSFANYNAHDLLAVLRYSVEVYYNPEKWAKLIRSVNKSQFSWKDSAQDYALIYEGLVPEHV